MADISKEKKNGSIVKTKKDKDSILSSDSDSSLLGIECDTCGINFSNSKSYESHMQGKKHQKMVAQAKFMLKYKNEKEDGGNKSESEDDEESKDIHCEVCDKYVTGHISYLAHLKGSTHAKNKKKEKLKKKMMGMPEVLDKENKGEDIDDDGILQKPFAHCAPCQKEFSGPEPFNLHLKSAVHKKKVQQSKTLEGLKSKYQDETNHSENEDEPFDSCKVCQKAFSGPVPYTIHMESSVHKKNLEKVKVAAEIKEFCSNDSEASYVCKECKKTFTDPIAFKYHLTNNSHEKRKAKLALLEFLTAHPEIVFVTPFEEQNTDDENDSDTTSQDYYLICKLCHASFSGPESAQDHVKSKKHINLRKEKKMMKLYKQKQSSSSKANGEEVPKNSTKVDNSLIKNDKEKNSEKSSADDFEMI